MPCLLLLNETEGSLGADRGDRVMKLASEPQSDGLDLVLLYRVRAALRQKRYTPLRSLIVTIDNGVVMVHGRVPTFYLRQIAIECIKSVAGVTRVLDRIDVVPGDRLGKERLGDESETSGLLTEQLAASTVLTHGMRGAPRPLMRGPHEHSVGDELHATVLEEVYPSVTTTMSKEREHAITT
ncbi:MAG: BON domain-containing protein [Planctomycetaceae bacterium]|nr:BON domain-containing protein [Planctomycetaceae bacterium]